MITPRALWVVELRIRGSWAPTVGVKLTRAEARRSLLGWGARCPDDHFRVVRYRPE